MPKLGRIARLGQKASEEVAFPSNATIDDLLAHFGENLSKGESLAIDGTPVDGDDEFDDGDVVYIVASTTGA